MSAPLTMPPRIETERLRLGPWRRDHFEPLAAFNADPEATQFIGGTMTRGQAWRALAAVVGHWTLRGYGFYAVELKDGTLVGGVGLYRPHGWPELELGYVLMPAAQGNGYATEAARAVRDEAIRHGLTRLVSFIHPDNHPSVAVAERLGASAEGTITLKGSPARVYAHAMRGGNAA